MGPTCNYSHTALHRVAASHTESFSINFSQFQSNFIVWMWGFISRARLLIRNRHLYTVILFCTKYPFQPTPTHPNPYLYRTCFAPPHDLIQPILTHPNTLHIKTQPIKFISTQPICRAAGRQWVAVSLRFNWYPLKNKICYCSSRNSSNGLMGFSCLVEGTT